MACISSGKNFVALLDLHPNLSRPSVFGIVIGKTDVRGFPDRKNFGSERYTFSFTIRDSPAYFINAFAWGKEEYIKSLSESFRVGDCVIIENPLVQTKDTEREEKFNPTTPSYYKLLISEVHSVVQIRASCEVEPSLLSLLHLPTKESHDYYSLSDIVENGQSLDGKVINVLAAVRLVGEPKCFTTSDRRKGQRCEVKLFDESVSSFTMICWDNESIQLAESWVPRETVIFASDVRINYDNFRNSMVATVISKTIITANPDTQEANILSCCVREYGETGVLDEESDEQARVQSIVDVYTVRQLKVKASQLEDKTSAVFGIVYAYLSTLNVDADIVQDADVLINESNTCTYCFCNDMSSDSNKSVITSFDLQVDLTDHTGTLHSCNLSGNVAQEALGCKVDQFLTLTEEQKTALKWTLLLERSKIYLKMFLSPSGRKWIKSDFAVMQNCRSSRG